MDTELCIWEPESENDLMQVQHLALSIGAIAGYDIPSRLRFALSAVEAGQLALHATPMQLVCILREEEEACIELRLRHSTGASVPGDAAASPPDVRERLVAQLPLPDKACIATLRAQCSRGAAHSTPLAQQASEQVQADPPLTEQEQPMQQAEQAADPLSWRESEAMFRVMADNAPIMIWISDREGQCGYVNKRWLDFTGRELGDEVGEGWMELIHPDDLSRCQELYANTFTEHLPFTIEYRLRRRDGQYRWLKDSGAPRFAPSGAFYGFVGSCTDIHEQRSYADSLERKVSERTTELRHANTELNRSNKELEQFAYVASHDLQEPLRKISVFSERLRQLSAEGMPAEARDYIQRMNSAALRMQTLVEDLLSFSKVSRNSAHLRMTDLNEVLQDVLSDISVQIEQNNAVIEAEPLPVLPAEPVYLRQLFQNLLGNAIKFHRPGLPPRICIGSQTVSGGNVPGLQPSMHYARITFGDNGIGFDDKHAGNIFVLFHRLHGRSEYPGTGIGLAICKKIVESHQGAIQASGVPGKGSTFTVWLPVQ